MALALVPVMRWRIASLDITNAFQPGQELGEGRQVYIRPPAEVLAEDRDVVWRAKKCVYGLADAPLSWHKSLTEQMVKLGGQVSKYDPNVIVFTREAQPTAKVTTGHQGAMGELGLNVDEDTHEGDGSMATGHTVTCGLAVLYVDDILLEGEHSFLEQMITDVCTSFGVGKVDRDEFKHLGVHVKHDGKENCI